MWCSNDDGKCGTDEKKGDHFNHFIAVGPAQFSVTLLSIVFGFQSHGNSQRTNEYHLHSSAMEDPILQIIIINVIYHCRILMMNQKIC